MSAPYWQDDMVTLFHGDCLKVLAEMEAASVDAVVTDPPYGLEFMGREWDSFKPPQARIRSRVDGRTNPAEGKSVTVTPESYSAGVPYQEWCEAWARECLRVLKAGGHMLAFGGTRTWHRLTCAVEDAGFEIRDSMHWIYAQGFPKSLDVSKAIDKTLGAGRPIVGGSWQDAPALTDSATAAAAAAEGWGTALKPAHEPIVVARKPVAGTVAQNFMEHGTGALNVDGCRVPGAEDGSRNRPPSRLGSTTTYAQDQWTRTTIVERRDTTGSGRWPPNVVLTHSAACELTGSRRIRGDARSGQGRGERPGGFADVGADRGGERPNGRLYGEEVVGVFACAPDCPVAELDRQSGVLTSGANPSRRGSDKFRDAYGDFAGQTECVAHRGADSGGASRFFPVFRYEAKAGSAERPRGEDGTAHPTVKPVDLMAWLVRLITPPGGLVLDPFAGSGTTAEACIVEGFRCVLIEKDPAYAELVRTRLRKPIQPAMFGEVS